MLEQEPFRYATVYQFAATIPEDHAFSDYCEQKIPLPSHHTVTPIHGVGALHFTYSNLHDSFAGCPDQNAMILQEPSTT